LLANAERSSRLKRSVSVSRPENQMKRSIITPTDRTDNPISRMSTQSAPSWAKSTNALDRFIARGA
jgi:hypothetical protein